MALEIHYIGSNFGSGADCQAACAAALAEKLRSLGYTAAAGERELTVQSAGQSVTLPMDLYPGSAASSAAADYGLLLMTEPETGEILICSMYAGAERSTPVCYSLNSSLLLCRDPAGTRLQVVGGYEAGGGISACWAGDAYGAFNLCTYYSAQNPEDYVILSPAVCRGRQQLLNCYTAPLYLVAGTVLELAGTRLVCLGGPLYYKL